MAVGSQQRKMVNIEEHKPQPVLQSYLELLYLHFSHYCIHWISSILTLSVRFCSIAHPLTVPLPMLKVARNQPKCSTIRVVHSKFPQALPCAVVAADNCVVLPKYGFFEEPLSTGQHYVIKAMSNADPKRMRSKLYNLLPLEMRGGSSSDTTSHPLAMVLYRKNRGRMEEVVAEEEEEEAKRVSFEGRR
ncbi:hypothetical protein BHM03_00052613 [Ensete ventricosum]|nr:hypothetical protein BHM03_00052613 [Ensete ventricosum]